MDLQRRTQIYPCPKCGTLGGWYEKRVCKYTQYFEPSGESLDASNMERVRGGERCFCNGCNRDITDHIQGHD
jgi:hypothetical protein